MSNRNAKAWIALLRVSLEGVKVKTEVQTIRGFTAYVNRNFSSERAAKRWYAKAEKSDRFCLEQFYKGLKRTK